MVSKTKIVSFFISLSTKKNSLMLTAIIIDDEKNSSEYLNNLLTRYFVSQIHVCDTASNIQDGVELIRLNNPDIVFLDIEMPNENGFKLFDYFNGDASFEVVFTTAHEEYAIKAIKNNAFDYLLKPVDKMDIMSLLKKYESKKTEKRKAEISLFNIKKGDSKK
jgi:two-component system LytT family response regulator